jgi:wobble nucleotide-excising tRNase
MAENGNGISVDVLAERIANISTKLNEQIALSKTAVDAALTAIQVAKSDQERTVTVAFAASQSAINKTEQSQKESNQNIGVLQNDVTRIKEALAHSSGTSGGVKESWGYIFGAVMAIVAIISLFLAIHNPSGR